MLNKTEKFIYDNWDSCIRENREGDDSLIGLPFPYSVPSPSGMFQEMYYWDTFFTNKGLIISGRVNQAKHNADNMLYLVEKYGYMPNGNRQHYLNRSQPPYLSMMIRDVYEETKDKEWLAKAVPVLKKEYEFWMTNRMTPTGLNQFGCSLEVPQHGYKYEQSVTEKKINQKRVGLTFADKTDDETARCLLTDCESGWDFNPRTDMHQTDCVYLDLNCNLYLYEKNFAYFSEILATNEEEKWERTAENRIKLMNQYLWNGECFADYNFKTQRFGTVFSVAAFYPLWAGIADKEQAKSTVAMLNKLEYRFGISTCEKNEAKGNYQWNYPNGWAPLQYITVSALHRYGYTEDAMRIAKKYVDTVEMNFEKTNNLWEKYNIVTGGIDVSNEYEMPTMLGWTAGVYLFMKKFLLNN